MTDLDMKNMEMLLQRNADQFGSEINLKLDRLLGIIEEMCCDLQRKESNQSRLSADERRSLRTLRA